MSLIKRASNARLESIRNAFLKSRETHRPGKRCPDCGIATKWIQTVDGAWHLVSSGTNKIHRTECAAVVDAVTATRRRRAQLKYTSRMTTEQRIALAHQDTRRSA